ncbi:unnamed protein product [Tenebrio molitor]|nr:unnamed protein product [Tenebrio molitor]
MKLRQCFLLSKWSESRVWQYSLALYMKERRIPRHCSGIYAVSTNFKHLLKKIPRKWICGTKTSKRQAKKKNSRSD